MIHEISEEKAEAIRVIIDDPVLNEILYLVKNGVPFDVAWVLKPVERFSWCVIFGRFDGGKFNSSTMQWEQPSVDTR